VDEVGDDVHPGANLEIADSFRRRDTQMRSRWRVCRPIIIATGLAIPITGSSVGAEEPEDAASIQWTDRFDVAGRDFASVGRNGYFILEPGYREVLAGTEGDDSIVLEITVLDETEIVDGIETRVVEERESANGKLIEVSRNFFAFCKHTSSVFYFGEDVDMYKGGRVVSHEGSWRAGVDSARAGLMIPGLVLVGSAYYQEIAPGVAMDRARIVRFDSVMETPAGRFERCLVTEETTPLEPTKGHERKVYAPGIGLIKDASLLLVHYGP